MKALVWIILVISVLVVFISGRVFLYPRIPSHVQKIEVLEQELNQIRIKQLSLYPRLILLARRDLAFAQALSPEDTPEKYVRLNQLVRRCKERVKEFNDYSKTLLPDKFCEPYMKDDEV